MTFFLNIFKKNNMKNIFIFFLILISFCSFSQIKWTGCAVTKKAFMKEIADAYKKEKGIIIELSGGGATKGIRNTSNKISDIGGTCRHSLDNEEKEKNVTLIPVAWDAIVVIVNKSNPINNITTDNIKKIYSGEITKWSEIGGNDEKINLHTRKGKISGVGFMLRLLLFYDQEIEYTKSIIYKSSAPLEKALENDINGIGITGISSAKKRNLKILKLNNVKPSFRNIVKGKYELIRPLYLTVHNDNINKKKILNFLNFILSKKGQRVIRKAGTVPIRKEKEKIMEKFMNKMKKAKQKLEKLQKDRKITKELLDMNLEKLMEMEIDDYE